MRYLPEGSGACRSAHAEGKDARADSRRDHSRGLEIRRLESVSIWRGGPVIENEGIGFRSAGATKSVLPLQQNRDTIFSFAGMRYTPPGSMKIRVEAD